ncbi:DNAH7, partial [Symbiodinium necroappetens]
MKTVAWALLVPAFVLEASALLLASECSDALDAPAWGIFIDGKNASEGSEAYGPAYTQNMLDTLKVVYDLQRNHRDEPIGFADFQVIQESLGMPFLDTYAGLFEMAKLPGRDFRKAYSCIRSSVPADAVAGMFSTDMEDLYDSGCIPNGKPCRAIKLPVQATMKKLFQSYHETLDKASTTPGRLRALASLMKNLAFLHPLPDRNGRSRLLILQFELRRLKLACGTMSFNNNNNVYTDSVDTLAAKIQEGIDMYAAAMASHQNPWLDQGVGLGVLRFLGLYQPFKGIPEGNVEKHHQKFPQPYALLITRRRISEAVLCTLAKAEKRLNVEVMSVMFSLWNPGGQFLPQTHGANQEIVAMMVPDYALIGEIVLYSVGFGNAKPLAAKAVASLRLGSEQLSSQDHYDFGMRALKSILVAAGQLRKKFGSSRAEDILMLSALNDVNLPKFTSNDIPLFLGITGDLFPGVKLPPSDYGKLINELEGAARARHLQPKASFIHKCTQLWETIMVRHGLMVVGMNVSGKSEVENVLAAALAAVADGDLYLPCQIHKINPKSIKQGQLYGDFDENTHEWTDGILALTVRYTANADPSHRQWIMLDGPVDAVWIENMNTVLDDNKKLCLNSGEIIKLSPVTTMMFEVEDLSAASPATVSRCGMVFMEQATVPQRDRVFAFRDFVVRTFEEELRSGPVLDMAG